MALTKIDIVKSIREKFGYPWKQAEQLIEILLEMLKSRLEAGDDVLISGFGKFCVKEKNQRKGRNPETGEEMMLRPRRVVSFKCSGKLKAKING